MDKINSNINSNKIIIPLGEECYTSQSIDSKFSQNNLRKCSFPFDYVGHTYIENIIKNIIDLFNSEDNFCSQKDFEYQLFEEKYFLCHNKYNYKYWHETIEEHELQTFIDKYNRRYNRLKEYLLNSDNIIIFSVNHFDNIYNKIYKQDSIYQLYQLLYSKNANIKYIAVNFGENLYDINNLIFINLPVNYDIEFNDSKKEFTKELYDYVYNELNI